MRLRKKAIPVLVAIVLVVIAIIGLNIKSIEYDKPEAYQKLEYGQIYQPQQVTYPVVYPVFPFLNKDFTVDGQYQEIVELGKYEVNYPFTFHSKKINCQTIVEVVDTVAPVLELTGGEVSVTQNKEYKEQGYKAVDNHDGDITDKVVVESNLDVTKVGEYKITYTVSDISGNTVSAERKVKVVAPAVNVVEPINITTAPKVVYLTFDDGPCANTAQLLDILDKYGAKATFFVTNQYSKYNYMIKEIYDRGHTVAVHTLTHNYSIYKSSETYWDDVNKMNEIIYQQTGHYASILRFPGGSSNTISKQYCKGIMSQLVKECKEKGWMYVDWNVSTGDGGNTNYQSVVNNAKKGIAKYAVPIVLQHDTKSYSVKAVEEILRWGTECGCTFKALTPDGPTTHHGVNN